VFVHRPHLLDASTAHGIVSTKVRLNALNALNTLNVLNILLVLIKYTKGYANLKGYTKGYVSKGYAKGYTKGYLIKKNVFYIKI